MSHGPCGLGGGALLIARADAAPVNTPPISASTSAARTRARLSGAPRRAASVRDAHLGCSRVQDNWLTRTGKRLIAPPRPEAIALLAARGRWRTRRLRAPAPLPRPRGRPCPPTAPSGV